MATGDCGTAEADGNVISIGGNKNVIAIHPEVVRHEYTKNHGSAHEESQGITMSGGSIHWGQWMSTKCQEIRLAHSGPHGHHACLLILQERHKLQTLSGPLNLDPSQAKLL